MQRFSYTPHGRSDGAATLGDPLAPVIDLLDEAHRELTVPDLAAVLLEVDQLAAVLGASRVPSLGPDQAMTGSDPGLTAAGRAVPVDGRGAVLRVHRRATPPRGADRPGDPAGGLHRGGRGQADGERHPGLSARSRRSQARQDRSLAAAGVPLPARVEPARVSSRNCGPNRAPIATKRRRPCDPRSPP